MKIKQLTQDEVKSLSVLIVFVVVKLPVLPPCCSNGVCS